VAAPLPPQAPAVKPAPAPAPAKVAAAPSDVSSAAASDKSAAMFKARPGWIIQVGAFDDEPAAKRRIDLARSKAKALLSKAEGFTERVTKDEKSIYRARFAGFDEKAALAVCRYLKRNEIGCFPIRN
jgi:D-alanyl-D-alanine carboxypeptidase